MYTDTEGIILKQINTVNGRRMLRLFSRKFGKISAGTGISEKSRSKAGLAMRPFTYGMYELYKGRGTYNINSAETIRSYYGIGNSVDKYMNASFVLELLDRITVEDHSSPQLFNLTLAFLSAIENRKKAFGTLVIAYELKMLKLLGLEPQLYNCTVCGKDLSDMTERKTTGKELFFNIKELPCGRNGVSPRSQSGGICVVSSAYQRGNRPKSTCDSRTSSRSFSSSRTFSG